VSAVVAGVVVGLALTAVALRSMLLLLAASPATPARQFNTHNLETRFALAGQPCEHCVVGIRPDGTDCVACDGTAMTLQPRDYLGRVLTPGGAAAATSPVAPPALTSEAAS
jgi:hypothetical protein